MDFMKEFGQIAMVSLGQSWNMLAFSEGRKDLSWDDEEILGIVLCKSYENFKTEHPADVEDVFDFAAKLFLACTQETAIWDKFSELLIGETVVSKLNGIVVGNH